MTLSHCVTLTCHNPGKTSAPFSESDPSVEWHVMILSGSGAGRTCVTCHCSVISAPYLYRVSQIICPCLRGHNCKHHFHNCLLPIVHTENSSAHQKDNYLNISKLSLLLIVKPFVSKSWPLKNRSIFWDSLYILRWSCVGSPRGWWGWHVTPVWQPMDDVRPPGLCQHVSRAFYIVRKHYPY